MTEALVVTGNFRRPSVDLILRLIIYGRFCYRQEGIQPSIVIRSTSPRVIFWSRRS